MPAWDLANFRWNWNINGFTQNPQNAWPNRRWVSLFIQNCEKEGIKPASKKDIAATYMSLINMNWEELKAVWEDNKQPVIVRKLASFIIKTKDISVIEKMLDRWIWKAVQEVVQEVSVKEKTEAEKQSIKDALKDFN